MLNAHKEFYEMNKVSMFACYITSPQSIVSYLAIDWL